MLDTLDFQQITDALQLILLDSIAAVPSQFMDLVALQQLHMNI